MTMRDNFITAGSLGSFIALAGLLAMAVLPRPFPGMDHFPLLSGLVHLEPELFAGYASYVRHNLALDSVYLLGHAVMWLGMASVAAKESSRVAGLLAVLGLLSAGLDFAENEMRWSALRALSVGQPLPVSLLADWQTLFGLSFWAVFLSALTAGISVAHRKGTARLISALAGALMLVAPAVYLTGHFPAFLWLIAWHAAAGVFLWTQRNRSSDSIQVSEVAP